MTRRTFALAAPALARGQAPVAAKYTGPLDGLESKVAMEAFDPVLWSRKLYESARLELTFRAADRRAAEAWQRRLRPKVAELVGGFPERRTPPKAQILETREFPAYRREKFIFESRPGLAVLGYLLTPASRRPPFAPVVCVPGHGRGVDDVVGIDEQGRDRTDKPGYEHDFAIQVAEAGLAAVAIEPMAFGCRRDPRHKARSLTTNSCQPAAGAALLLGQTMIAWRVFDVMRTLDWIETRSELDPRRAGCMGISGGGTCTLFSAALEPRIRAAFVSGYLNTFRDSILSLSHCMDNYVPGILHWCEMYDVAGLIAPRPLIAESGDRDAIFPVDAARESFARVRRVYEVLGAGQNVEHEVFSGEHSFHGARGIPFLARHLA